MLCCKSLLDCFLYTATFDLLTKWVEDKRTTPMLSMYGVFPYIYHKKNQPNEGKYTMHVWHGTYCWWKKSCTSWYVVYSRFPSFIHLKWCRVSSSNSTSNTEEPFEKSTKQFHQTTSKADVLEAEIDAPETSEVMFSKGWREWPTTNLEDHPSS